jgi:hypothetical protein
MTKLKYGYPSAIIQQARKGSPSAIVTIPIKTMKKMGWNTGDVLVFIEGTEGLESWCKIKKFQQ